MKANPTTADTLTIMARKIETQRQVIDELLIITMGLAIQTNLIPSYEKLCELQWKLKDEEEK